jgi:8-oxo-dGTP diphosphatase
MSQQDLYSIPVDDFFKSAFSVDCVIFGYDGKSLEVLLIKRGAEPFKHFWALPGDLVYPGEDLDVSADRILHDLTSLDDIPVTQVHAFGKVNRHPLGRVITIAYTAIVEKSNINPHPASWAEATEWHPVGEVPKLAFDHEEILGIALTHLKTLAKAEPIWANVLPKKFTITQLQEFYEIIFEKKLDKGNFRKKTREMRFLQKLSELQKNVNHRPSALYKFDEQVYLEQKNMQDLLFDL